MLWDIFCMLGNPDFQNWPDYEYSQQNNDILPKFIPTGLSFINNSHRDFDENALDLLTKMLSVDPWKRPSCQQILEHPFLSS
jgi:serine/threonine protein kinase